VQLSISFSDTFEGNQVQLSIIIIINTFISHVRHETLVIHSILDNMHTETDVHTVIHTTQQSQTITDSHRQSQTDIITDTRTAQETQRHVHMTYRQSHTEHAG